MRSFGLGSRVLLGSLGLALTGGVPDGQSRTVHAPDRANAEANASATGVSLGSRTVAPGPRAAGPGTVVSYTKFDPVPGTFLTSLAYLGDVDGDGVGDIAIGDRYDDEDAINAGAVHSVFLNADASVKGTQKINTSQGGFSYALGLKDHFGVGLEAMGDFDGDGIQELLVGAPQDSVLTPGFGNAWMLFLNADGTVRDQVRYSQGVGGFQETIEDDDFFGSGFAPLGDLDGNGILDFAITKAWGPSSQNSYLFTLRLKADGTVKNTLKVGPGLGGVTGTTWLRWGDAACSLPDLDGDGLREIVVGDRGFCCGDPGKLTILFPNPNGSVHGQQQISPVYGSFGTLGGDGGLGLWLEGGDQFGVSATAVGDLNGDGVTDLAVGASSADELPGDSAVGMVAILFLNPDGTVRGHQAISKLEGSWVSPLQSLDAFGHSLAGAGDWNGNGTTTELFVGSNTGLYVLSLRTL